MVGMDRPESYDEWNKRVTDLAIAGQHPDMATFIKKHRGPSDKLYLYRFYVRDCAAAGFKPEPFSPKRGK
jgi:hypothetical protein